jgi:hypothetical protein
MKPSVKVENGTLHIVAPSELASYGEAVHVAWDERGYPEVRGARRSYKVAVPFRSPAPDEWIPPDGFRGRLEVTFADGVRWELPDMLLVDMDISLNRAFGAPPEAPLRGLLRMSFEVVERLGG